jgi:hypothetical protein
MHYQELLAELHRALEPANYVEIGCRHGRSLALSRSPALAIDPVPEITINIACPHQIFAETSDEFFAARDPKKLLGRDIDFAFIDGMHLVENVLRDFANIEVHSHRGTVIVIDDVLPAAMEYATRDRNTTIWCGDVYRIVGLLRSKRPDLAIEVLDIEMKGACIVWQLNPQGFRRDQLAEMETTLQNGAFCEPDVVGIRRTAQPLQPEILPTLIQTIRAFRAKVAEQPGGVQI